MNIAYLALGGNKGDRKQCIEHALAGISGSCGIIIKQSAIYETAAWGVANQPDFLNMAICIQTSLSAGELLIATQNIEQQLGRVRTQKWGQRTMDIDLLLYNNEIIQRPELTIPHPLMQERRFVLVPLAEIAPDVMHPVLHKTVNELLAECGDALDVRTYNG